MGEKPKPDLDKILTLGLDSGLSEEIKDEVMSVIQKRGEAIRDSLEQSPQPRQDAKKPLLALIDLVHPPDDNQDSEQPE